MPPKKTRLYESKHPFDTHPFEAICCGSWQSVELIRIRDGTVKIKFVDDQYTIEGKGPTANLRLRSRRATVSDCTCFLRPGVDICVFLDPKCTESSAEEDLHPVWIDAKISSIERKPHRSHCKCQFYVSLFIDQAPLGSERGMISKETVVVGIDQISILQKLEQFPCESERYRWNFSEDCSVLPRTKLFLGKFSSDLCWLLVSSVLKNISFDVRSFQNKIVYQIIDADDENNCLKALGFKVEDDGVSSPIVVNYTPNDNAVEGTSRAVAIVGPPLPSHDSVNLRRSKRRYVQPERFLGCESEQEDDGIPTGTFRTAKWIELPVPEERKEEEEEEEEKEEEEEENGEEDDMMLPLSHLFTGRKRRPEAEDEVEEKETSRETKALIVYKRNKKKREATPDKTQSELAIVPFMPSDSHPLVLKQYHPDTNGGIGSSSKKNSKTSYFTYRAPTRKKKSVPNTGDMDVGNGWKGNSSYKKAPMHRYRSMSSRRQTVSDYQQKRTLSAGAYNDLINSYMKDIDSTVQKKEDPGPRSIPQWKESLAAKCSEKREESEPSSSEEDDGETSETEMLWKEMELAMASVYILGDNEGPNDGEPTEILQKSSKGCKHDFKLNEEIGIICKLCGIVSTEIKDVSPPLMQPHYTGYNTDNKKREEEDSEQKADGDDASYAFRNNDDPEIAETEEHDNVWALIPEVRRKLHLHQKKAYEFLWKNIAGSLEPAHMNPMSKNVGGCVVSHTPGAGKTLLIIAFLVSYLRLFPGKRPLVLAPKTTLYTWYKEFIKWEIPIPVHLIHGRRTFRVCRQRSVQFRGPKPTNDVMHILDCLEKIQKWHAHPSVLVMGYTSFLTLMREDSKFQHRKYMARVLRESPGILILDEGHNPRSTKSRCRKVLMKVETQLRILLSGTLFQNNFCEYFNTLCLARPKFMDEVLRELDPKYKRKKSEKARHLIESRARKFFLDNIAKKIDSNIGEERLQGLNMLRNITSGFIDVYEGGGCAETLPGLQSYTLMMNSTNLQQEILRKLHGVMATYNGYPLELELLITLGSIHPSLVRTSNCAGKFFNSDELQKLENHKNDYRKGSKVMFVLNLVFRVCTNEKVLIFCHNIAPIHLFEELFENLFKWQKGKEVLVLTGDLELFERGKIMDKFEDPSGPSKILLASITACAEGISLTAASRVVMLDSEWNPSKTKQAIARAFRPGQLKVVYVYQLLASGTLEEDKYRRTTWKEWVSNMIFSEAFVEDPTRPQANRIEDDILRDMVEVDRVKSIHMIMKNEKKSTL